MGIQQIFLYISEIYYNNQAQEATQLINKSKSEIKGQKVGEMKPD